jgi:hypothetical protein
VHRSPVIVIGGARTDILHDCSAKWIHPSASRSQPSLRGRKTEGGCGKKNTQLTLPPPPRHCPVCTIVERPPSAGLGRLSCVRTVREPGKRCERHCIGCMCAGSLKVVGPASSMSIRRFLSAIERRLAMTHPAVPPATHTSS